METYLHLFPNTQPWIHRLTVGMIKITDSIFIIIPPSSQIFQQLIKSYRDGLFIYWHLDKPTGTPARSCIQKFWNMCCFINRLFFFTKTFCWSKIWQFGASFLMGWVWVCAIKFLAYVQSIHGEGRRERREKSMHTVNQWFTFESWKSISGLLLALYSLLSNTSSILVKHISLESYHYLCL